MSNSRIAVAPLTIQDAEVLLSAARRAADAAGVGGGAPEQDHTFAAAAVEAIG